MLQDPKITAFLPTTDSKKSKEFYTNILGLNLVSEDNFALEFEGMGSVLRITIVREFQPHPFTVLGFKIENIEQQVTALLHKNVTFERFNELDQDDLGIWTSPGSARIAWFKDPDGNLLSLTEV